jgi:hypothetical protein
MGNRLHKSRRSDFGRKKAGKLVSTGPILTRDLNFCRLTLQITAPFLHAG